MDCGGQAATPGSCSDCAVEPVFAKTILLGDRVFIFIYPLMPVYGLPRCAISPVNIPLVCISPAAVPRVAIHIPIRFTIQRVSRLSQPFLPLYQTASPDARNLHLNPSGSPTEPANLASPKRHSLPRSHCLSQPHSPEYHWFRMRLADSDSVPSLSSMRIPILDRTSWYCGPHGCWFCCFRGGYMDVHHMPGVLARIPAGALAEVLCPSTASLDAVSWLWLRGPLPGRPHNQTSATPGPVVSRGFLLPPARATFLSLHPTAIPARARLSVPWGV